MCKKISVLRKAFSMFDGSKSGKIELAKVRLILNTLGYTYDDSELDGLLSAEDTEGEKMWKIFNQSRNDENARLGKKK